MRLNTGRFDWLSDRGGLNSAEGSAGIQQEPGGSVGGLTGGGAGAVLGEDDA